MSKAAITGNMDRILSEDESRIAGKAAADFTRRMGGNPRELTVYTLSVIIRFMAGDRGVAGELEIIDELESLSDSGKGEHGK